MNPNENHIVVLMGGVSSERDISMRSGREVSDALRRTGYRVRDIVVDDPEIDRLDGQGVDAAFIALHGTFGEDGAVQALLEERGIPYTGSGVTASRLAIDKIASKIEFGIAQLATPDYVDITRCSGEADLFEAVHSIGAPVVVKPARDGSSLGVRIVSDMNELNRAIHYAGEYGDEIVIERYIDGREFTVGILMDEALPVIEVKPASGFYNYSSKYRDKQTQYITDIDLERSVYDEIQRLALSAHRALGCKDISRVDIILNDLGHPYILEVNTIPGFTKRSLFPKAAETAGIDFDSLCDVITRQAIGRMNKTLAIR